MQDRAQRALFPEEPLVRLDDWYRDALIALRSLRRRRSYAAVCLATLAAGIATAVAMFAVLHAVLLRPLPVRDQDRLVYVTKHLKDDRQDLPFWLLDLTALREALNGPLARPRFNAALLLALAAVALMALGAERAQIGRGILATGLLLTALGLVLGLGVSVIAARLLESLLYGVKPVDVVTLVVTSLVLTVITILACLAPTIRAAKIDPVASLRLE